MPKKLLPEAEQYAKQNHRRRIWRKFVRFMACIVVFCTTYALILPAITMEKKCELEEHTHSESCYSKITAEQVSELTCTYESLDVHVHTQDCYDAENHLVCGYADYLVHQHDASCTDETGAILCLLPEVAEHEHSQACDQTIETEEVVAVHTHDDTCYSVEQGELTCQIHTHSDDCHTRGALVCAQTEMAGHTHDAECSETVLNCDLTVEPHVHDETACYQQLVCELPEDETHTHSDACNGRVLNCDLTEQAHTHTDTCYQTNSLCDLPEQEGHSHTDECCEWVLSCGADAAEEHQHTADCYAQIRTLICQLEEGIPAVEREAMETIPATEPELELICEKKIIKLHSHADNCYEIYTDDTGKQQSRLICTELVVLDHTHSDTCFTTSEIPLENSDSLTCGLTESEGHTHSESCYDESGVQICTEQTQAHTHSELCYGTWELICELEEHIHDAQCTPLLGLSEEDRAAVEHVIALIEALPTLDETTAQAEAVDPDSEEYQIWFSELSWNARIAYDAYEALPEALRQYVPDTTKMDDLAWTWQTNMLANDVVASIDVYYINWSSFTSDDATNQLTTIVYGGSPREVIGEGAVRNYIGWEAYVIEKEPDGFYVRSINRDTAVDKRDIKPETAEGFILLVYGKDRLSNVAVGQSVQVSPQNFYKTKDSATDYDGTITFTTPKDNSNELDIVESASTRELITLNLFNYGDNINEMWEKDKKYPGFQSPEASAIADANRMDFGNSITAEIGASTVQGAGDDKGAINKWHVIGNEGTINYPISGAIKSELVEGYPALEDGTSLAYLFSANEASTVTKANSENIDGLFQYDETTGRYYFDSRENAARFDEGTSTFVLYEQIMTPNFIIYPFGNFLPFNDIRTQTTQTTQIDKAWFSEVAASALQKYHNTNDNRYKTLYDVLTTFDSNMGNGNWDYHDAVTKYFNSVSALPAAPSRDDARFSNMYTIDYDEPTDFFFGMSMHMDFMQPKGGLTGPDGKQPMEYTFAGDDDVWIFVDGKLFLDLSGIHRHVGGQIDFVNGEVRYYELLPGTGDVNTTPYKTVKFKDILGATDGLNDKGTFVDYSSHTMDFYYMERGSGSSVCKIEFNFPLLKKNGITVTKELEGIDGTKVLGNPDFRFQVYRENGTDLLIGEGKEYTILDQNGNVICTGKTGANGVFTIKAGQSAAFGDILENEGRYFVRELLDSEIFSQYDKVIVDGSSTTVDSYTDVEIDSETFKGVDSPVKNMSDGSTSFIFHNQVDTEKFGTLELSKELLHASAADLDKEFTFILQFDGKLAAAGTSYTLIDTNGTEIPMTIAPDGKLALKHGQTARFENIIAGTAFDVTESSASSEGYIVTYHHQNAHEAVISENGISGIITADTVVKVNVANADYITIVSLPIQKTYLGNSGNATFQFGVAQVDADGNVLAQLEGTSITVTGADAASGEIYIKYSSGVEDGTYYYRVYEKSGSLNAIYDTTVYRVAVQVSNGVASILSVDDVSYNGSALSFVNQKLTNVAITKTVTGNISPQGLRFSFTATVLYNGAAYTPADNSAYTVNEDGTVTFELEAGETVTIRGIPVGAQLTVTETVREGFEPSYTVGGTVMEGETVTYTVAESANSIVCNNEGTYLLPKTGGAGTTIYAMAGLMLMLLSMAYLLYRFSKRRREAV